MSKKLKKLVTELQHEISQVGNTPFNAKQIAARLGLKGKDTEIIPFVLEQMLHSGDIAESGSGRYQAVQKTTIKEGRLELTLKGSGYLIAEDGSPDVFVQAAHLNTANHNDRVKVELLRSRNADRPEGKVVSVEQRSRNSFVGKLVFRGKKAELQPDDRRMFAEITVPPDKLNGAKADDKVVVEIETWSPQNRHTGQVTEVLGQAGLHNTEMHAIVAEFGFATRFSKEVEKEADAIPFQIPVKAVQGRRDFREILTLTIDPDDAKDFDDALSYRMLPGGRTEVGIHIADVSHYVQPDTLLDKEAYRRATSVYLVDRTIPMLPEKLSNGVCSLRPNEDKLTFSAVFELDENANVCKEWFGRTVIHSRRRFTYEEAQQRLSSGQGDLAEELRHLNKLAGGLREQRYKNGALNFETEEVKFKLAADGTPLSVYIKVRQDAHKLIEEFMLLANRKVAEFISTKHKPKPFLYRIHESPNAEKLEQFGQFAKRFGIQIDSGSPKSLARSLEAMVKKTEGRPEQHMLQNLAIRSMAKAKYTTKSTAHYGLAFNHYTHFTSPIRRYPDVLAHRLLQDYMDKKPGTAATRLEEQCKHSSEMESKAAEAERASVKYKQVEYMAGSVGKTFQGIISGVTEWGLYVELTESRCEGMVRVSSMHGDHYTYDEKNMCLRGQKRKKTYTLGQAVTVKVLRADMEKKQLDFALNE